MNTTTTRTRSRLAFASTFVAAILATLAIAAAPAAAEFGIASFDGSVTNRNGTPDTQAGSHPYQDTTTIMFAQTTTSKGQPIPDGAFKDVYVELPAGFIGNPNAIAKCTEAALNIGMCPGDSQVGTTVLYSASGSTPAQGVYNMVPPPGKPAAFAFSIPGAFNANLTGTVRSGGDYGLDVTVLSISQLLPLSGSSLTFWGVPGDLSHDADRICPGEVSPCSGGPQIPFLTNPSACGGPLKTTAYADSWQHPGALNADGTPNLSDPNWKTASFVTHDELGNPVGVSGCDRLDFSPSLLLAPDTEAAHAPSGLDVKLHLPQNSNPVGLGEAALKDATVVLPAGMAVNPATADGLESCSAAQFGLHEAGTPSCPDASRLGSVEVHTPLLKAPLQGSVYLGPLSTPFTGKLPLYVLAEDKSLGVIVKLEGKGEADPTTGQLTTRFENNPQVPFEDLELKLFGGPRAPLSTPGCGTWEASAAFTPWSSQNFTLANPAPFSIATACGGGFAPSFLAGTTNYRAGGFGSFVTSIARSDQDQSLGQVAVQPPPGLLGMLSKVDLCPEPQAGTGDCPAASQIGHVLAAAGVGPNPVYLPQAGRREDPVFLTGPYKGAPFGLSIVAHAEAGPANLGDIVVRAGIYVDPHTARINVISDALPSIKGGVPLALRKVTVTVDREGFMFNPTNCNPLTVNGTIVSAQGAGAAVSSHFQAADCAALRFHPHFKVSTAGAASTRSGGASLRVNLSASQGPQSNSAASEANIKRVDVQLPKALAARLTTLQKACIAAQFETNPAGCPAASFVGLAVAHTPVLKNALTGPAILVSHGSAGFPDLVVVLQGEGVALDLTGNTFITHGITSSKFDSVPDAPISSFELNLPESKHSALASPGGNLCGKHLTMPTTMEAQNGAVFKQSTKIAVTGCYHPARAASLHRPHSQ